MCTVEDVCTRVFLDRHLVVILFGFSSFVSTHTKNICKIWMLVFQAFIETEVKIKRVLKDD